ncbi:MAG: efflux RND transporter periplasmic adaptor subunit [Chromatiales bacterium]|jgi:HlyD family secretion protein|nr:efflux RND transporter periplasmic adaptor subunit [Chromatiales bacterium]
MNLRPWASALLVTVVAACGGQPEATKTVYETLPVTRRDIVVSVEAAGQIEPAITVELKSKASGEILSVDGETGRVMPAGTLLVQIDKRQPRNAVAQAEAQLEAAKARRGIAEAQARRSEKLLEERIINDVDFEQSQLEAANAKAEVVRTQVALENARIQLDDTDVRAPITGTIIEKLVEKGQVISSPVMDVGGGSLLLKMADLTTVQVKTLVDETDIGKIRPGLPATVTVTAFPNQPFAGSVLKIEPLASADQTVTTFAVRIVLDNAQGLLKPGMNADVDILVAERRGVLAVPMGALRTDRDIATSAKLLGLDEATVRQQLAAAPAAGTPAPGAADADGYRYESRFWVFVQRDGKPVAQRVTTGLTDLDYSEVIAGLAENDAVFILPSSGLVENQQRFQQQMRNMMGMPGMGQQQGRPGSGGQGEGQGRPAGGGERPAR